MPAETFVTRDGREIAVNAVCDEGQFAGYVFGLGGPFVQYIDVTRLEEAIRVYHTEKQGKV